MARVIKGISLLFVVMLLLLQLRLWLGDGSIKEVLALKTSVAEQQEKNDRLIDRNHRLEAEISDLKNQLDALEERARKDLGMIKQGETFYQFSDQAMK